MKKQNKKDITKRKILDAAKKVFSSHSYNAASIRRIGKELGLSHPLINYYYPSKAELFIEMMKEICDEFYHANSSWFEGREGKSLEEGFKLFIKQMVDYNFNHPELLRIISLNLSLAGKFDEIPGYGLLTDILLRTRKKFEKSTPMKASAREIGIFINSFNAMMLAFIGSSYGQAKIIGMDHESPEYRKWVIDAFYNIFIHRLKELVQ